MTQSLINDCKVWLGYEASFNGIITKNMMVYNLQSLSQAVSLHKFSTEAEKYAEITGYVQDVLPAFLRL